MKEFFRGPAWVSSAAQAEWEPRIRAAAQAWSEIESLTVSEGLRDSGLFFVTPDELLLMTRAGHGQGLEVTTVGSGPPGIRAALHRPGLRGAWLEAWSTSDDVAIGRLLGFPECCIEFFQRLWSSGKRDTTLSMAPGTSRLGGILLRWLGVRLVGHLPCGHGCEATERLAVAHAELGRKHGLAEGVEAIERLLSLPMEYSALHGAGVVETPFFRFMFSTDYTARKEAFSKPGPRSTPAPAFVDFGRGVLAQLYGSACLIEVDPPSWRDNGFATWAAMEAAHATIERAVPADAQSIIDLGCGDGALLARLRASRPGARCVGVDCDAGRIARGRRRHPALALEVGRIEDRIQVLRDVDVALFMPGRLFELPQELAHHLMLALRNRQRVKRLVAYAYSDHLPLPLGAVSLASEHSGDVPILSGPGVEVALLEGRRMMEAQAATCGARTCQGAICQLPVEPAHHHDAGAEWHVGGHDDRGPDDPEGRI